jgi:hypothetical protein
MSGPERIEVTVTLGEKQVTLAGPEAFVRAEVQRLTNLIASSANPATSHGETTEGLPPTERELLALKQPSGHPETVTAFAYLLKERGQFEFTHEDIRRCYARAGARPPKVMQQALRDARNLHDYLEAGSKQGAFRLSPHGERTVEFDLPRKKAK